MLLLKYSSPIGSIKLTQSKLISMSSKVYRNYKIHQQAIVLYYDISCQFNYFIIV